VASPAGERLSSMTAHNPLADAFDDDADDLALVRRSQEGDRAALEALIGRHQDWIYNIVLRMVYHPQDAEDATQELLVKLLTKLSTFEGRSRFRTWLYRIVVNHVLNMKRARGEAAEWTFARYGDGLDTTPDTELPDLRSVPVDVQLVLDESRITCSSGMLLCLTREQRLVYILGEIFAVSDALGADLLETTRANFRQKLSRARRDLHSFMQSKCGLVNTANPCRCAKKTQAFMKAGYVDPQNLLFARAHVTRVRDVSPRVHEDIDALDLAYAEIHRDHPFHRSPDFVAVLRGLLSEPRFQSIFGPH
jgi:RNA polymerase sigma factor (sigma-70 family)